MERASVVIIGSGNVATHLVRAIDECCDVVQILSHNISHAELLAGQMRNAQAINDINLLNTNADYYLISVNDDAISEIARKMPGVNGVVMHTSGSKGIETLDGTSKMTGVLYPLQTFSKHAEVDVSKVPFFLEASDAESMHRIEALAKNLSTRIYYADSAQRTVLHIAAVFGCNFFNHLLSISSDILTAHGYSLDVLRPLLEVTLDKAMSIGPDNAQTGPAARGDKGIIARHIAMLDPHQGEIYRLLSDSIMNKKNDIK